MGGFCASAVTKTLTIGSAPWAHEFCYAVVPHSKELLVEINRFSKLGVKFDFQILHLTFTFVCLCSEDRHLAIYSLLVLLEASQSACLGHVDEGFPDFVAVSTEGQCRNRVNHGRAKSDRTRSSSSASSSSVERSSSASFSCYRAEVRRAQTSDEHTAYFEVREFLFDYSDPVVQFGEGVNTLLILCDISAVFSELVKI